MMSDTILLNKEIIPDDSLVKKHLGKVFSVITAKRNFIAENIGGTREEWKHYGIKIRMESEDLFEKAELVLYHCLRQFY